MQLTRRRIAKAASELVPTPWLLGLRSAYLTEGRSALARRCIRPLLEVARLRGIPQNDSFLVPGSECNTTHGSGIRMLPTDSYIVNYLYWLGYDSYEAAQPAWWANLVRSHQSVLEVGANVGLYTLVGASAAPGTEYRAVEANPTSCEILRRNLALNELGGVKVVEAAVVGKRDVDKVSLNFPRSDPYKTSLGAFVDGAVGVSAATTASHSVIVPTVAIANLVDGVDLVKLDIEGLELEVLSAIRDWIVSQRPTLVVEILDESTELQPFLADLVSEAGYEAYVVDHGVTRRVTSVAATAGSLEARYGTRDVTFIQPDRAASPRSAA